MLKSCTFRLSEYRLLIKYLRRQIPQRQFRFFRKKPEPRENIFIVKIPSLYPIFIYFFLFCSRPPKCIKALSFIPRPVLANRVFTCPSGLGDPSNQHGRLQELCASTILDPSRIHLTIFQQEENCYSLPMYRARSAEATRVRSPNETNPITKDFPPFPFRVPKQYT